MSRKNYPAHSGERVYQARYTDKKGNLVKQTRALTIMSAIKRIPSNFTKYPTAVEVEVIHIHDRYKHPEALGTVERASVKKFACFIEVMRPRLP